MMKSPITNTTLFETPFRLDSDEARSLQRLGFPQPLPEAGQVWYSLFNNHPWLLCDGGEGGLVAKSLLYENRVISFSGTVSEGGVYAPTPQEALTFLSTLK